MPYNLFGSQTHPAECSCVLKVHGRSNVNVARVTDESPSRRTLSTEDAAVIHVEGLEVDLQKVQHVAAVLDAAHHRQGFVVAPPVVLRVDRSLPNVQTAARRNETLRHCTSRQRVSVH